VFIIKPAMPCVARVQALDERRLKLEVDYHGRILSASTGTPTTLFGLDASQLSGTRIFDLLDFMHQDPANPGSLAA
jgi:hypothetical protein